MTTPRKIIAAGASLTLVALAAGTIVWGDSSGSRQRKASPLTGVIRTPSDVGAPVEDLSLGRFARTPLLTYETLKGELHFALQVQAKLPTATPRPRDIAVVIDTSASQVGSPLKNARLIAAELAKTAKAGDRVAIWTVNTPDATKSLTGGFQDPSSKPVADAIEILKSTEFAAGATDLKNGLRKVLNSFRDSGKQQVILFLGDGESTLQPLTDADRSALAADMVSREIGFFPVPLGSRLDPKTLHGLASASGGAVVRMLGEEKVEKFLPKLTAAFDAPVFYPSTKAVQFSDAILEAMPNRLPPLRSDSPTLVVGLMKKAETLGLTVDGTVAGKPVTVTVSEKTPAADAANYFLVSVVHQWRNADHSAPALVRADRGLALSFEQTRLTREELLTQAHWALSQNQLDAAQKLFESAGKIDPRDPEPQTGLKVVAKLKDGQLTREQLRQQMNAANPALKIGAEGNGVQVTKVNLNELVNEQQPETPPATPGDLLELEKRRRQIQEQQVTQVVDDTIKRARSLIASDPDGAYDLLKRQLGSIRENTDLSDKMRATLASRLESALRNAVAEGAIVKQRQEAELQRRLAEQARQAVDAAKQTDEERIRERVRSFGALMNQARYEEAYKEALVLVQEQQSKGKPVPVQATAAYQMALNAANLREFEELRRIKEDRFLLTMLQVEKSHVPFPDEPPVEFPPARVWRELTALRKDKYDAVGLEGPASRNALRIRDKLLQPASIEKPIDGAPLKDVLEFLSEKYDLTFIVDVQAFDRIGKRTVEDEQVRLPKMPGVALGTILRFILAQVNGSLLIRRDYIEITTVDQTILEKAVRAYPVADLVIPIPNGVNNQVLNQNLQILGGSLSANGQAIFGALGGGAALGFNGSLGALGVLGPLGALGGAGAGIGGAAGLGGGAAGAGATGAGFQGAIGFGGGNNQTNLGFGGGTLGFGGGQQGQFGNLGGQFGIQGGDTSSILVELIQDVIAPKEWQLRAARYLFNNVNTQIDENEQPILNPDQLNSLGYYQPSRALVVRATSRIQTRIGGAITSGRPAGNAAANKPGADALVIGPGNRGGKDPTQVAKAKPEPKKPVENPVVVAKGERKPAEVWNKAMNDGLLNPRQVIAVADALAIGEKFDEIVALLKANLRQGVLVQPCVFDALALALRASGGAPEEIERVYLSSIDFDPKNSQAFLAAAKGLNDLGKTEDAVALCKRAAAIEPNASDAYSDSLAYLVKAKAVDSDAVQWAADNLLRRDWSSEQSPLQVQAQQAIQDVVAKLKAAGRTSEADRLAGALRGHDNRDLVIELIWSDPADLDLEIHEPTGAICSPLYPQSTGGGVWRGDRVLSKDRAQAYQESYVAAEAFSGSYEVRVRTVWGKPLGGKATIRVTRQQGTPNQSQELHRVEFNSDGIATLKVQVDNGRRTEIATVPPPAPRRTEVATGTSPDRIFNLLRSMSEPSFTASSKTPIAGGTSAAGGMNTQMMEITPDIGPEIIHQNKLSTGMSTGTDMQGQAVVSSDRKSIKWSLSPVFQTASNEPEVKLSSIPGGK